MSLLNPEGCPPGLYPESPVGTLAKPKEKPPEGTGLPVPCGNDPPSTPVENPALKDPPWKKALEPDGKVGFSVPEGRSLLEAWACRVDLSTAGADNRTASDAAIASNGLATLN